MVVQGSDPAEVDDPDAAAGLDEEIAWVRVAVEEAIVEDGLGHDTRRLLGEAEEALAGPDHDRVNHQPQLVGKVVFHQRMHRLQLEPHPPAPARTLLLSSILAPSGTPRRGSVRREGTIQSARLRGVPFAGVAVMTPPVWGVLAAGSM